MLESKTSQARRHVMRFEMYKVIQGNEVRDLSGYTKKTLKERQVKMPAP